MLAPSIGTNAVDSAIGVGASECWYSTPNSTTNHAFYAGTSKVAQISGAGDLTVSGKVVVGPTAVSITSGSSGGNYGLTLPAYLPDRQVSLIVDNVGAITYGEATPLGESGAAAIRGGPVSIDNGQSTPTTLFNVNSVTMPAFFGTITVLMAISNQGQLTTLYEVRGVNASSGWSLSVDRIGDDTGVGLTIDTLGNVCYTTTLINNRASALLNYNMYR